MADVTAEANNGSRRRTPGIWLLFYGVHDLLISYFSPRDDADGDVTAIRSDLTSFMTYFFSLSLQ